jgi:hypothetical protein
MEGSLTSLPTHLYAAGIDIGYRRLPILIIEMTVATGKIRVVAAVLFDPMMNTIVHDYGEGRPRRISRTPYQPQADLTAANIDVYQNTGRLIRNYDPLFAHGGALTTVIENQQDHLRKGAAGNYAISKAIPAVIACVDEEHGISGRLVMHRLKKTGLKRGSRAMEEGLSPATVAAMTQAAYNKRKADEELLFVDRLKEDGDEHALAFFRDLKTNERLTHHKLDDLTDAGGLAVAYLDERRAKLMPKKRKSKVSTMASTAAAGPRTTPAAAVGAAAAAGPTSASPPDLEDAFVELVAPRPRPSPSLPKKFIPRQMVGAVGPPSVPPPTFVLIPKEEGGI